VVQNRVTLETRNPFAGAALSIFSVTRNHHFLNHALWGVRQPPQDSFERLRHLIQFERQFSGP
jgi:hypothetical protein